MINLDYGIRFLGMTAKQISDMQLQHQLFKNALKDIADTNASKHGTTSMMLTRCTLIARAALEAVE